MEVFVLLKGYDYEGFGSDVEVFSTREAAEARKQAYSDGEIKLKGQDDILFDYDYDLLKIVKRTIKGMDNLAPQPNPEMKNSNIKSTF